MSNKNRLVSIVNWNLYQEVDKPNDNQMINKCETTDKQLITNKNERMEKCKNNIYISAKANKHKYGKYQNVLLKDEELQNLKDTYLNWEDLITYLDEYIEMKGYKAKSHYLAIKKWVVDAVGTKPKQQQQQKISYRVVGE